METRNSVQLAVATLFLYTSMLCLLVPIIRGMPFASSQMDRVAGPLPASSSSPSSSSSSSLPNHYFKLSARRDNRKVCVTVNPDRFRLMNRATPECFDLFESGYFNVSQNHPANGIEDTRVWIHVPAIDKYVCSGASNLAAASQQQMRLVQLESFSHLQNISSNCLWRQSKFGSFHSGFSLAEDSELYITSNTRYGLRIEPKRSSNFHQFKLQSISSAAALLNMRPPSVHQSDINTIDGNKPPKHHRKHHHHKNATERALRRKEKERIAYKTLLASREWAATGRNIFRTELDHNPELGCLLQHNCNSPSTSTSSSTPQSDSNQSNQQQSPSSSSSSTSASAPPPSLSFTRDSLSSAAAAGSRQPERPWDYHRMLNGAYKLFKKNNLRHSMKKARQVAGFPLPVSRRR